MGRVVLTISLTMAGGLPYPGARIAQGMVYDFDGCYYSILPPAAPEGPVRPQETMTAKSHVDK